MPTTTDFTPAFARRIPPEAIAFASTSYFEAVTPAVAKEPWHRSDEYPPHVLHVADLIVHPWMASCAPKAVWQERDEARLQRLTEGKAYPFARVQVYEFPRAWINRAGLPYWEAFDRMDYGPLGSLGMAFDFFEELYQRVVGPGRGVGSVFVLQHLEVAPAFRRAGHARVLTERVLRAVSRSPADLVIAASEGSMTTHDLFPRGEELDEAARGYYLGLLGFAPMPTPPSIGVVTERIDARIGDFGRGSLPCFFRPVRCSPDFALEVAEGEDPIALLEILSIELMAARAADDVVDEIELEDDEELDSELDEEEVIGTADDAVDSGDVRPPPPRGPSLN